MGAEKQYEKCNDVRGQAHSKVLMADVELMMGHKASAEHIANQAMELVEGVPGTGDIEAAAKTVIDKAQKKDIAPVVTTTGAVAIESAPTAGASAVAAAPAKVAISKDIVRAK